MTERETLKLALEAMTYADACLKKQLTTKSKHEYAQDLLLEAGNAIKEALAQQPEQEPVRREQKMFMEEQEFYTTPPQRTWVGLTYEDMVALQKDLYDKNGEFVLPTTLAMAVEAKLKEKNT